MLHMTMRYLMTNYYWINDLKIVAKEADFVSYLYDMAKKEWVHDENKCLMDRRMGFDISEPADSPYRIGSSDMMDKVEEISEEKALEISQPGLQKISSSSLRFYKRG